MMAMPSPGAVWPAMVRMLWQDASAVERDGAANVEDDDTSAVTDGIAESRAAIGQCGHVIYRTANAGTGRDRAETERAVGEYSFAGSRR